MNTYKNYLNTTFNRACRKESVDHTPVWMMRQAGRYMPEYQAIRAKMDFLTLCKTPEVAAQATLDAARILGTDAAIIFSDITLPGEAMGLELDFAPGPKFTTPVRTMADVDKLKIFDPKDELGYVMKAIELTRKGLPDDVSLIGFVGAPATLSAYLIEGIPGKSWIEFKRMAYGEPEIFEALLDKVSEVVARHAREQVLAGCDAIQLFDTSAGELATPELKRFAFGAAKRVVEKLGDLGVPIIYFARNVSANLELAKEIGSDVLGVDWTIELPEARRRLGDDMVLQGNLDPTVLFTNPEEVDRRVKKILDDAKGMPGFVFNLGHGVLHKTHVENVKQVVKSVHAYTKS